MRVSAALLGSALFVVTVSASADEHPIELEVRRPPRDAVAAPSAGSSGAFFAVLGAGILLLLVPRSPSILLEDRPTAISNTNRPTHAGFRLGGRGIELWF